MIMLSSSSRSSNQTSKCVEQRWANNSVFEYIARIAFRPFVVGHDVSHGVSLYTTYHEVSQITKITLCVVSKVASMPSMLTNMIKEEKGRLCSAYPILLYASSTKNRNSQEVSYMSNVISPARLSNQSQTILIGRVWRMRRGEPMNRGCLNVSDVSDAWGLAKTPASLLGFSICPASQKSVELMVLSHQYTEKKISWQIFQIKAVQCGALQRLVISDMCGHH